MLKTLATFAAGALALLALAGGLGAVTPARAAPMAESDAVLVDIAAGRGSGSGVDTAGWMGALNATLLNKRLRDIRWPGAHDAGTGGFHKPYVVVHDRKANGGLYKAWEYLHNNPLFPWLANLLSDRIALLGQAQPFDIGNQLRAGARYFDCRMFKEASGDVVLTHTVVGQSAMSVAADVRAHLRAHPNELVILHERQREGFADLADYMDFLANFTQALGGPDVLVPASASWAATYGEIVATAQPGRVIYIMCHESKSGDPPCQTLGAPAGQGKYWSPSTATTMWPNAQDSATIQTRFDKQMAEWAAPAYNNTLCVAQLVYSPTDKQYVEFAILDKSLKGEGAKLRAALPSQITGWGTTAATAHGVNVLMYDFVDDPATAQAIIALNSA